MVTLMVSLSHVIGHRLIYRRELPPASLIYEYFLKAFVQSLGNVFSVLASKSYYICNCYDTTYITFDGIKN